MKKLTLPDVDPQQGQAIVHARSAARARAKQKHSKSQYA
jgi:hypothetical protein